MLGTLLKLLVKDKLLSRKRRERGRAKHAAQTASERQATLRERERMPAETPEERETRLQRTSTNQRERSSVETPEERNEVTADERQTVHPPLIHCTRCIAQVV